MDMSAQQILSQYIMLKGEPGTRKSTQALSYPKPQYWFSWDQKMLAMKLPMKKWGINPKLIQWDDYRDWNPARAKLESFLISRESFNPQPIPFKTIVIDSVTSMADGALSQMKDMKRGTTRASGAQAGKNVAGISVNEIEDYMAESAALQELISLTKQIKALHNVNIILIAHVIQAEYKTSPNSPSTISRTIVTAGKRIAPKIPAYCEEVYHFNIKKSFDASSGGEYSLLTTHTGDDFARTGLELPAEIVFGDKPLYDTWVKPAIDSLNGDL